MPNLVKIPWSDGIQGCFDYKDFQTGDTVWLNQYNQDINFILDKPEYIKRENNAMFFSRKSYEAHDSDEYAHSGAAYTEKLFKDKEFTFYAIFKCVFDHFNASGAVYGNHGDPMLHFYGNNRVGGAENMWAGRYELNDDYCLGQGNCWVFEEGYDVGYAGDMQRKFAYPVSEYRVFAFTFNGETGKVIGYINGEKVEVMDFFNEYRDSALKEIHRIGINTVWANNFYPSGREHNGYPLYIKCICFFDKVHSDSAVALNSGWLGSQYGVCSNLDLTSQTTEDCAIATALARNAAWNNQFGNIIKAWKLGVEDQEDEDGDPNEDVDLDEFPVDVRDDEDGVDDDGINWDPFYTDGRIDHPNGYYSIISTGEGETYPVVVASSATIWSGGIGGTCVVAFYIIIKTYTPEGELYYEDRIRIGGATTYTRYNGSEEIFSHQRATIDSISEGYIHGTSYYVQYIGTGQTLFGGAYLTKDPDAIPEDRASEWSYKLPFPATRFST